MVKKANATEYDFTLSLRLPDSGTDPAEWLAAVSASCDDATVGIGRTGRIALDVSRAGVTAEDAMRSALADVLRAIPGAELIEAGPDYANVVDIAEVMGVTRQRVRAVIEAAVDFPVPVHEGSSALYHLAPILEWLELHEHRMVDSSFREAARAAMRLNLEHGMALVGR